MTWGAGGTTSESTLFLSSYIQNYIGVDVLMHITCRCLTKEKIDSALESAKNNGIVNLLCLRGDPPAGLTNYDSSQDYFQYAEDLIKYVREKYGDYFCICVAGYPGTHVESKSKEEDLFYLKRKIDAGADFIITQLFYDANEFLNFVSDCSKFGINCPILPGILPIQNYTSFKKLANLIKIKIPEELLEKLESVKGDDEKVKQYGIENCVEMCQKIIDNGIHGIHFYTMNLEKSVNETLKKIDFKVSPRAKDFPWKKYNNPKRNQENVRPIFWKNNYKSYLSKTWYWDEFPNGIWGDSRSPAFGNMMDHLNSYYPGNNIVDKKKVKQMKLQWGEKITCYEDVCQVFVNYINGKITKLPWCEESEFSNEIELIKDLLYKLNSHGMLSINSQPAVNARPSNDPYVGWGPEDGYVYQRMYIEFFIQKDKMDLLIEILNKYSSIYYQAVNKNGDILSKNSKQSVIGLTWGVFPNREIIQPTIYDSDVFLVWKEEAFNMWNEWIRLYTDDDIGQESADLLGKVRDTFYLMTIVDNDYIIPKLEQIMEDFCVAIDNKAVDVRLDFNFK